MHTNVVRSHDLREAKALFCFMQHSLYVFLVELVLNNRQLLI